MEQFLKALFGIVLSGLGFATLRFLTFGRYPPSSLSPKQEILLRLVGMFVFMLVWLALAQLLGWKPK